jgi:putative hydrolase of the HAD superfamily
MRAGDGRVERALQTARAYVFDFYGTLIDDDPSVPPMWAYLNELGYGSHPELEAAFEPNSFDGMLTPRADGDPSHDDWLNAGWRRFLELSGVPAPELDATLARMLERRHNFEVRAAARVPELLALLSERGVKLGLCSNWETPIGPYLERAGLLEGFDSIVTSSECGARKPHAAIFEHVSAELGVEPGATVFVGDSWTADVVGALRAGMIPVWLRLGRPSRGLAGIVAEFETVAELEAALSL